MRGEKHGPRGRGRNAVTVEAMEAGTWVEKTKKQKRAEEARKRRAEHARRRLKATEVEASLQC